MHLLNCGETSLCMLFQHQCWKKHNIKWRGIRFPPQRPFLLYWICFKVFVLPCESASACHKMLVEVEDNLGYWPCLLLLWESFSLSWHVIFQGLSCLFHLSSYSVLRLQMCVLFHLPFLWGLGIWALIGRLTQKALYPLRCPQPMFYDFLKEKHNLSHLMSQAVTVMLLA